MAQLINIVIRLTMKSRMGVVKIMMVGHLLTKKSTTFGGEFNIHVNLIRIYDSGGNQLRKIDTKQHNLHEISIKAQEVNCNMKTRNVSQINSTNIHENEITNNKNQEI